MSMDTKADFGNGPNAVVRRWLKELDLAEKTEKEFRDIGDKIWKRYRGTQRRRNSFNILWSNTETLAPALFNTPPSPDVRRRFRDDDPVGKIASQILERCLEFQTDTEQFMGCVKQDVLDAILPGRGVSRIKYVPSLVPAEPAPGVPAAVEGAAPKTPTETPEGDQIVAWEQAEIDHVQWDDFRRGPGKVWAEVQWVAFGHQMNREELTDLCGAVIAKEITLDKCQDESIDKDEHLKTVFGTVKVWEFWCREDRKVRYVCAGYTKGCLKELDDPLELIDFFPCPRPLYAIADSSCLIPTALFEQYREQADELDRISSRINRLVDALKVRGIYDSTIVEFNELMRADDNKLIPSQNQSTLMQYMEKGGLEKAIYWMPIEQAAKVLTELYQQREQCKAIIYELSGIADVRRGATDPNETLGAQKLKADFGNQRISGLRLEVERYVRDLMRLMAELISEKFSPQTLLRMSQMQIPNEQEIEGKKAELLAQSGGDPSKLPPRPISLEKVLEVLKDDATRMFKIDVETDSMVSATVNEDMMGLQQVLTGVVQFIDGIGPAVQAGAVPAEAVKEIVMTICRRAKMGSAVEDALDKIQAPKPQADPNAAKAEQAAQAAQVKAETDQAIAAAKTDSAARIAEIKAESDARIAQIEAAAQQQTDIVRQQAEAAQHQQKLDNEAQLAALKQSFDERDRMREERFLRWKAELEVAGKIEVAKQTAKNREEDAATDAATNEIASEVTQ